ncbi:hypothetical protein, partial [Escherichia coli]|uniref:hypothetical protein n=1 Tax=Escherichia coli TaxID=562 RepID=UPI001BC866F2
MLNNCFDFIHLHFANLQDFVLSVHVSKPHFSAKYSAYLSIPQHASALSWSCLLYTPDAADERSYDRLRLSRTRQITCDNC